MANRIIGNPKITWIMFSLLVVALVYSGFAFASVVRQPAEPVEVVAVRERAFDVSSKKYQPKKTADPIQEQPVTDSSQDNVSDKDSTEKTPELEASSRTKQQPERSPGLLSSAVSKLINLVNR